MYGRTHDGGQGTVSGNGSLTIVVSGTPGTTVPSGRIRDRPQTEIPAYAW